MHLLDRFWPHGLFVAGFLLAGCAPPGAEPPSKEDGYCYYMDHHGATVDTTADAACLACDIAAPAAAADGNLASFATLHIPAAAALGSVALRGSVSRTYAAGVRAGAVLALSRGSLLRRLEVRTYLLGELRDRGDFSGETAITEAEEKPHFVGLTATQPFDAVEVAFGHAAPVTGVAETLRVYELCHAYTGD